MQHFVLQHYPDVEVVYTFKNRDKSMKFTHDFMGNFYNEIEYMEKLRLTDKEHDWLKETLPFLPITYRQYLASYRFDSNCVYAGITKEGDLEITIKGKWRDTILWEVPLMAIISELYFKIIDVDWTMEQQEELIETKARDMSKNFCNFADFGTRRRRSYDTQDMVIKCFSQHRNRCVGTSNPHFAMKHHMKPIGTCAHEAISGVAALDNLNHPNREFMDKWEQTYGGRLGIMLPDTFGLDSFLKDFTLEKAKLWDGVRHDSGDPYKFTDKILKHYRKLDIEPTSKTIVYSDSLDTDLAIRLKEYCGDRIKSSDGIGTHLTNDFIVESDPSQRSKPLNMVIKLTEANGIPVVKLSDTPEKAIGDPKMVEVMKYIHNG